VATVTKHLTAGTLVVIAGLHVAWGWGSPFPFADRDQLADAVVGARRVPSSSACYAVAGALGAAAALVQGVPRLAPRPRRVGLLGVAGVLGLRGVLGLAGRTGLASPGSESPRFRRLDRRLYAPLCVALALGALDARRSAL